MSGGPSLDSIWSRDHGFRLPERPVEPCAHARQFSEWAHALLARLLAGADRAALDRTKVLLVDRYFEWRAHVPAQHRNRLGQTGHPCIFQVFADAYQQLKVAELALTPPAAVVPPRATPPPPTPGIY